MSIPCAVCDRPILDGYVCTGDAKSLAEKLVVAAEHAEDAVVVVARQTRYGAARGGRKPEPEPVAVAEDLRRNPVTAFGWQASIERPPAGALRPEPMPADLGASDRLHAVENTIGTWARDLGADADDLPAAARWLATHIDSLRHHPAADEAFKDLENACRQLERLVDRPADKELVGMCDCGKVLYASRGRTVVTCPQPTCKLPWHVERSREILRKALDGKLVTASEAARLAAYLDGDRTQDAIRKLIASRAATGQLGTRGQLHGEDAYRFGEVVAVLAAIPRRRAREGAAA